MHERVLCCRRYRLHTITLLLWQRVQNCMHYARRWRVLICHTIKLKASLTVHVMLTVELSQKWEVVVIVMIKKIKIALIMSMTSVWIVNKLRTIVAKHRMQIKVLNSVNKYIYCQMRAVIKLTNITLLQIITIIVVKMTKMRMTFTLLTQKMMMLMSKILTTKPRVQEHKLLKLQRVNKTIKMENSSDKNNGHSDQLHLTSRIATNRQCTLTRTQSY